MSAFFQFIAVRWPSLKTGRLQQFAAQFHNKIISQPRWWVVTFMVFVIWLGVSRTIEQLTTTHDASKTAALAPPYPSTSLIEIGVPYPSSMLYPAFERGYRVNLHNNSTTTTAECALWLTGLYRDDANLLKMYNLPAMLLWKSNVSESAVAGGLYEIPPGHDLPFEVAFINTKKNQLQIPTPGQRYYFIRPDYSSHELPQGSYLMKIRAAGINCLSDERNIHVKYGGGLVLEAY